MAPYSLSLIVLLAVAVQLAWQCNILSRLFNTILRLRYPIINLDTKQPLPTLPFIFPNGQGNVEKFLNGRQNSLKWGSQYGPLYRIWSGFSGEIVLTEPSDIETVFRDSHTHHKATSSNSGHLMHLLLGSCLGLISGAAWKTLRRATEAPFLRPATISYIPAIQSRAKHHLTSLQTSAVFSTYGQLDPIADLKLFPFLAVAEIIYGPLSPDLEARLLALTPGREAVFRTVIQGGITRFRASQLLPLRANRELHAFKTAWARWNDDAHAVALLRAEKAAGQAPIVAMYAAVGGGGGSGGGITGEQLLQTLDEMLFANLDVTMGGLSWPLIFLAAHPRAQEQLRQEIAAHGTAAADVEKTTATRAATATVTDSYLLSPSTYLHATLLEASRLRPLAAFSVPQSCPTPRVLGGKYLVPAGTNFVVDAYALNVRHAVWGPDNTTFRPERWIGEEGEQRQRGRDLRYCYWRFGFGPRVCLGRHVADLIIKVLVVELVKGWELRLEGEQGKEWKWDKETWIHHPSMRITCMRRGVGEGK